MIDQLDDIKKRTDLEIKNIESFEPKMDELRTTINELKEKYKNEKKECENKIEECERKIFKIINCMECIALHHHDQKRLEIQNQYRQMKDELSSKSKWFKILNYEERKQLEVWTSLKCSTILFDSDKNNWNNNKIFLFKNNQ